MIKKTVFYFCKFIIKNFSIFSCLSAANMWAAQTFLNNSQLQFSMRPPITFDDWNVKYFISQQMKTEDEGETKWNSKARSQRSDKQSRNTFQARNQNNTKNSILLCGDGKQLPPFRLSPVLFFYWFIDEAHGKGRDEEKSHPCSSCFMYRKEQKFINFVSQCWSQCQKNILAVPVAFISCVMGSSWEERRINR